MGIDIGMQLSGFTVTKRDELPEINGEAYQMTHARSGARLLYLQNDDNNKAFSIAFRTPPCNDTGVFHILEHSVLCGSEKFPVREPFVDLLKTSMQTFLNAMTFPDKTMYPVASTNEQDLFNLMDVYLDAVFHPAIYHKRAIFEQEGWHLELVPSPDAPEDADPATLTADQSTLVYNGVVYNEMKGGLSDASSVLFDEIQKALLPDTPYAFESGGTPAAIPTLTYEDYLDDHQRHYRTDNSYIVLYGNLDIERALAFLDERYLTPVAAEQREADAKRIEAGLAPLEPRTLSIQEALVAPHTVRTMDTAPENACSACGYVVGTAADRIRVTAVDVLLDALFGSNEAPLKRALLDEGIADDVHAFLADSILQPYAVVQLNVPHDEGGARLARSLDSHVRTLLENGLDKQLVEASLSHMEFQMREHELGIADGVVHAMMALAGWLYDENAALDYLRYEDAFAHLRAALETDYYEELLRSLFLENPHTASVEVLPTPGKSDDGTAVRLAQLNERLTPEERAGIVAEEAVLRQLQMQPDSPEAMATLPRLSIADIDEAPEEPGYELDGSQAVPCLRHHVPTNGIAYANRYFDESHLTFDDLPYVSVLALVLGKLATARHTAAEIDTLVQGKLGNFTLFTEVHEDVDDIAVVKPVFVVSASALAENVGALSGLVREILLETDFSDTARIRDILVQRKIEAEQVFTNSGHSCAAARARSYYSPAGVVYEQLGNVGFYQFVRTLLDRFDEQAEALAKRLASLAESLFVDDACTLGFAGSEADYERFWDSDPICGRTGSPESRLVVPEPRVLNEAFIVPSDVCFASYAWDRRLIGTPNTGVWSIASRALSYDFLWNEVRVKGGAYGVGFTVSRMGNMRFYSFRDPHLDETLARFEQASQWLADFDPQPEDMEGFVVSTVAGIDAPIKPRKLIHRQEGEFFARRPPEERCEMRAQAIAAKPEDVRALAPTVRAITDARAICVFGNRAILEASKAPLSLVELF